MSARSNVRLGTIVVIAVALGVGAWYYFRPKPAPLADGPPPIVSLSSSPYLNTAPDATYVGSAACIRCHEAEHKSYLRTGMSRSTTEVDPAKEPADMVFDHVASGRRYRVERKGRELWHRELLLGSKPEIVLAEFPVNYAVGSGRFGKTYLAEPDGFLVESPLTYYTSKSAWAMSPGYDSQAQPGFERPVGGPCLYCHLGRTQVEGQSMHRYRVLETAIGCERCHGPGSLHVAARAKPAATNVSADDFTIVNPRKLPRDLAESVCQQCHLSAELLVPARGRKPEDFRPGLPLQDVMAGFTFADDAKMTVTGHVEQLHQSKCYQKSSTLTCITCHDPHGFPEPKQRVAYFQAKCQECHAPAACKVDPKARHAQSPNNDCAQCHMPRGATDIPHVAFSHHRIGIHAAAGSPGKERPPPEVRAGREPLRPFHDLSRYGGLDRDRLLGIAYCFAGTRLEPSAATESYMRRADQLLTRVWHQGVRDGTAVAALARVRYWLGRNGDPPQDIRGFCDAALQDQDLPGDDRCEMLLFRSTVEARYQYVTEAAESLRQAARLRRNALDWSMLAECEQLLGRPEESLRALEHAATIAPADEEIRQQLISLYEKKGNRDRAEYHRQRLVKK